ncbi:MAG: protein kinase, partial [Mariprofundaceae bacterium]|nr:protein kinase [Mariprofundaceae bacterium]
MSLDTLSHIGNYRLAQQLGAGGMGIVYRAVDESLGREVAIKVLHPHLLKNKEHKERFRREARVHAKLMHPNIVTLLALHEEDHQMALIMEMVHGKNLKEHLQQEENYAIADLIQIALAVLAGLEAAHRIGLIHRDLKPANVLIATTGEVKLMDFGLAKSATGEDDLTQTGATVGSFRYMAPEQITNKTLDQRTDIYSFGILLYQMVTGHLPFDASAKEGGEFAIMEKQVRELPQLPHEVNPEVPLALSDLILRMMAKDPDERPRHCDDVRQSLQSVLQNLSAQASAPSFARLTESATKYFELDVKKSEEQWQQLKQISWMKKPLAITLGLSLFCILALMIWFTQDDKVSDKLPSTPLQPIHPSQPLLNKPHAEPVPTPINQEPEQPPQKDIRLPEKEVKKVTQAIKQEALTPSSKVQPINKPKPVKKTIKATKPLEKKKLKKKLIQPIESNILDRVAYKVRRLNGEKVDVSQPHEFHGASHRYFEDLSVTKKRTDRKSV